MNVSLIIIHYHTPLHLGMLLDSFFHNVSIHSHDYELIIINNGGNLDHIKSMNYPISPLYIESEGNLGYAGGINKGVSLSVGDFIFLMNTDLILHPNSLETLISHLGQYSAVGPQFYLDKERTFMLPPNEPIDFTYRLIKILSRSFQYFVHRLHDKWWKNALDHLLSIKSLNSQYLSGAMIGITKEAWQEVGPMDEGYKLYFEESDWLLRLKKKNLISAYIPEASVTHAYNQSPKDISLTSKWFENSEQRFMKKHSLIFERILLQIFEKILQNQPLKNKTPNWVRNKEKSTSLFEPITLTEDIPWEDNRYFIEVSIFKSFVPSTVMEIVENDSKKGWVLSQEIWDNLECGLYFLRMISLDGKQVLPNASQL